MPKDNLPAALEALLFVNGEALKIKKLATLTNYDETSILSGLDELESNLTNRHSGLFLLRQDQAVKLATRPDLSDLINKLIKDDFDSDLTPAALETLSIISYLSPVSRASIDYIRGVNSSFILRSLLLRGLISRQTDPKRSYVYLYKPTFALLEFLGVKSTTELPNYTDYKNMLQSQAVESTPNQSV